MNIVQLVKHFEDTPPANGHEAMMFIKDHMNNEELCTGFLWTVMKIEEIPFLLMEHNFTLLMSAFALVMTERLNPGVEDEYVEYQVEKLRNDLKDL